MPDPFLRGYSPQLVSRCPIPHLAIPVPIRQVTLIWLNCGGWKGEKGDPAGTRNFYRTLSCEAFIVLYADAFLGPGRLNLG